MRAEPVDGGDPRAVLRALRSALEGAGPALALGCEAAEVPAGTAAVIATSGSSGYPKRVLLSRSAMLASAWATSSRIGPGAWLLALPAHYIAGVQVLVRSIASGREPAVLSGSFTAQGFAAAAATMTSSVGGTRVANLTALVPAQLATLLEASEDPEVRRALRAFDAILVGGQALPRRTAERAEELGARIVRTYGATETSGGCVYDGTPLDGVRVRISNGEVLLNGPMLADGYLDDAERTAAAFDLDHNGVRWYRTGDAGAFSDGRLRVTGRLDNVIISGGINVSLDRVEAAVRAIPGLEHAVVVPIADERWGEGSAVVVETAAIAHAEAEAGGRALIDVVRSEVEAAIGAAARPARILGVDRLPMLRSGKPDRPRTRALAAGA